MPKQFVQNTKQAPNIEIPSFLQQYKMPLKRKPQSQLSSNLCAGVAYSDPDLTTSNNMADTLLSNVQHRQIKAKREDQLLDKNDLDTFKVEIMKVFNELKTSMEVIKSQNCKLQESVEFTAKKYDEINTKLVQIEKTKYEQQKYICQLEGKIEQLERQGRATSVEIRNIPKNKTENRQYLTEKLLKMASVLNMPLVSTEIKNIFRINSAKPSPPIIVEFTTIQNKENILTSIKRYNRMNTGNRLNTGHLNIEGTSVPIYISENLTAKTKRLFFLAREIASHLNYKYCWTSHGKIFLRKNEGSSLVNVNSEQDINSLKKSQ